MMTQTDTIGWNLKNSYQSLPDLFYSSVEPTPTKHPEIIFLNEALADSLGLSREELQNEQGKAILAGNAIPDGAKPIAQSYAGHQFGSFTRLGDGRAILLGEQQTKDNELYDIQLKGAGKTWYSRAGDGLASIGPMLREYLISEAMYGLGIPTTRSLAVVKSEDTVMREQPLHRGILTRVAKSHLRVGTFQYAMAWGENSDVEKIADYAIERHYPHLMAESQPYEKFFEAVLEEQAQLIAAWQLVGFIHGVMNTDNMSICGETIDYGPCAFMNSFDLNTVFSSIDVQGRYKFGNQPAIAHWNLTRFAETLLPLFDENQEKAIDKAKTMLEAFFPRFNDLWLNGMREKLGLFESYKTDYSLVVDLLDMMKTHQADYTDTFLDLTFHQETANSFTTTTDFKEWKKRWTERIHEEGKSWEDVQEKMKRNNPALIPRNHLVEEALQAAVQDEDYQPMQKLMKALVDPYAHSKTQAALNQIPVPDTPYQTFCGT